MAEPGLKEVKTPTLLIAGSLDTEVIQLNEKAFAVLRTAKEIRIISGAGHLFEEPGKLEEAAGAAVEWFEKYLTTITA